MAILNCSACGCDVDESTMNTTGVVQHGSRIYCVQCAALIMSPEEQRQAAGKASPAPKQPAASTTNAAKPRMPKVISAVRRTGGKEIVEEFRIATGAQARVAAPPSSAAPTSPPVARAVPPAPAPVRAAAPPAKARPVRPDINFSKAAQPEDLPELVPMEPAQPANKVSSTKLPKPAPTSAVSPSAETAPMLPAMRKGHWPKPPAPSISVAQLERRPAPPAAPPQPPARSTAAKPFSGRPSVRADAVASDVVAPLIPIDAVIPTDAVIPRLAPAAPAAVAGMIPVDAPIPQPPAAAPVAAPPPVAPPAKASVRKTAPQPAPAAPLLLADDSGLRDDEPDVPAAALEEVTDVEAEEVAEVEAEEAPERSTGKQGQRQAKAAAADEEPEAADLEEVDASDEQEPESGGESAEDEEEGVLRPRRRPSNRTSISGASAEDTAPEIQPPRSTRRMLNGKSARSESQRGSREDRSSKRPAGAPAKAAGMSTGMMIGIGVGGFALLLILGLALSGGDKEGKDKKSAETVKDEGEKTPASQLEQLAKQSMAGGNVSGAYQYYVRAANRAEQDGNVSQARAYNMQAQNIKLNSKLHDR